MKQVNITTAAQDRKKGLTLEGLCEFTRDAMRAGFPGDTVIEGTVGFRGQVQKVSITGPVDDVPSVPDGDRHG